MATSDEIRDDGRGRGQTPFSVASVRTDSLASRAEDRAERPAPGAANGEALVMPLEGGGEVRFTAVHGRVDMQIRVGKQRSWLTTPVSAERAYQCARRLDIIAQTAAGQRQAKGA